MKIFRVILFIAILLYLGFTIYTEISSSSTRKVIEQQLITEYQSIHTFAGEQGGLNGFSVKSGNAIICHDFSTAAPYQEIKRYYDKELLNLGWQFVGETVNLDGGKIISYRKGKFDLTIEYREKVGSNRPQYYLSISWN